jgi:transposase-like protein
LKSTALLERLNEELKRRTLVVRIFPNTASCLRLTRALAVEMHDGWIEATRYLNLDLLREQRRVRERRRGRLNFAKLLRGYALRSPAKFQLASL